MGKDNLKNLILTVLFIFPALVFSQPNDCRRAVVICSDKSFSFTPRFGAGSDDFSNPNNDPGCLERRENISVWFYFEFRKDMPAHSGISFTLQDTAAFNCGQDYDFALYRANGSCDNLGSPVRCSFAQIDANQRIIRTGMGGGATDTTENLLGDGFVDSLRVQPGEGFYLLVDFFVGVCTSFDSTSAQSFRFSWGGTAAPYLNCIANPNCDQVFVSAGPDSTVCAGTEYVLQGAYGGANGGEVWSWKGIQEADDFLVTRNTPTARLQIPADAFGDFTYVARLEEGNCVHTDTVVLQVRPLPFPVVLGDEELCPGQAGQLMTGSGYASYHWSTGDSTVSTAINGPGTYSVTVVNSFGCAGRDSALVSPRPLPVAAISGDTILCPGEETVLRAAPGFTSYQWSNGMVSDSIVVQTGGMYLVTITNGAGCSASLGVEVRMVHPAPPPIYGNDYFCAGATTELFTDSTFRSIQWSTGSMQRRIQVSVAGALRLMVVDSFGCPSESILVVRSVDNPLPVIQGIPYFCTGDSTQLRTAESYSSYRWSGNQNQPILVVSQPGTYRVEVTDSRGCVGADSVLVEQKLLPQPVIQGLRGFCAGSFSRLSVPGGYPVFAWSTGEVLPDIRVVQGGVYRVTVTDSFGCVGEAAVPVEVFENPTPVITGPEKLCPDSLALLNLNTSYASYSWSGGQTTQGILAATAGTYQVTVTDIQGCMGSASFTLEAQPAPLVSIAGVPRICEGDTAIWTATAGFMTYSWSNGSKTVSQPLTQGGLYILTVYDAYGCGTKAEKALAVLSNPEVAIAGPASFCAGSPVSLEAPFGYSSYAWSTGSNEETTSIEEGGTYVLTVTTAQGCQRIAEIMVEAYTPVTPSVVPGTYNLCPRDTVRLDAGPGFSTYQWSDGSSAQSLNVYKGGNYYLSVVDSNGCGTTVRWDAFEVEIKTPTIFGPPSLCTGQPVQFVAGMDNYVAFLWSTGDQKPVIQVAQGGTYALTVTDKYGCMAMSTKFIEEKPSPVIDIAGKLSICRGDSTTLSVSGGYSNYTWTTGATDTSIVVNRPGPYGILVLGANGCAVSDEVEVVQSRIPYPVIDGDRFFCARDSVLLEVEAGFPSYHWSTGQMGNSIFVSREGIYRVTVYDELGCSGFAGVKVFSMEVPVPEIIGARPFCPDDSVALHLSKPYPGVTWFPSQYVGDSLFARQAGSVSVEVVASNGCKGRDTILLSHLPAPVPDILGNPYFCAGSETVLSVKDTFAAITWLSNTQRGPSVIINQPQPVEVLVYNALGCSGKDTISVSEIPLPLVEPIADTTLDCRRRSVQIGHASWDSSKLRADWFGPGLSAGQAHLLRPTVTAGGRYAVVLEDLEFGCVSDTGYFSVEDLAYAPDLRIWVADTLDCGTDTVRIQAASSDTPLSLEWYASGSLLHRGMDLVVQYPGWYRGVLTDSLTGCSNEQEVEVKGDFTAPMPRIEGMDTLTCARPEITLTVLEHKGLEYAWSANQNASLQSADHFLRVVAPGVYAVQVRNTRNGCTGRDSVQIVQDTLSPNPDAGPDEVLDCHSQDAFLQVQVSNPGWKFFWRDAATAFILSRSDSLRVELSGTFILEAQDKKNGCIGRDTLVVRAPENLPANLVLEAVPETCAGYSDGVIRVRGISGGVPPFVYRMSGVEFFSTGTDFPKLRPGEYRIIAQDAVGCETSKKIVVPEGVFPYLTLGPDQYISLGDFVQLQAETSIPDAALGYFSWTVPDTLTNKSARRLTLQPLGSTEYRAVIRDTNGCEAKSTVRVFVEATQRLFIPNAFSPDGDGINDVFMLFAGPEVVRIRYLRLFDRWGEQLFVRSDFLPNDAAYGWDGTFQGVALNPAVFVYVAEVEYLDGRKEIVKGDVLLVR